MKVYVPKLNKEGFGGGNTFVANFRKYTTLELTDTKEGSDAMFVANPMWAEREDFGYFLKENKRIVLRLDNIPEDWNNRGTAISKLRDFIEWTDEIVYQSEWSQEKYDEFGAPSGTVILNGVDTQVFNPEGDTIGRLGRPTILYVKSSRNENKRYPEAMEIFRRYWQRNKKAMLLLVGQFADDIRTYNFGFYNGESYKYLGVLPQEQMATIYRSSDVLLFPAYADCAPNVVLEAMASGCVPIIHEYGGGREYVRDNGVYLNDYGPAYDSMIEDTLSIDREQLFLDTRKRFSVQEMAKHYDEVICGK